MNLSRIQIPKGTLVTSSLHFLLVPATSTFGSTCSTIFVNTFVCMHLSSISFRRRERDSNNYTSDYLHLFTLQVTKKCSFNILKTISFKIEKKTSIEAQSEVKATKGLTKSNRKKMHALSEARDFGHSNPVALERTVCKCYPHTIQK